MRRALVVGQAPSRRSDSARPLEGRCARRLAELAGLASEEELRRRARLANVLPAFPGKASKGDRFARVAEARRLASAIDPRGCSRLVLLGRRVAAAYGEGGRQYLEPFRIGRRPALVLPHPSGMNRWWNDPANARRAALALRRFLR